MKFRLQDMRILSFFSHPWKFLKAFFFDHEPLFGIQSKQSASLFNTARRMHAFNWELKQQRRRRLRKRHLKNEFALPQTLSHLFHLVYFIKCWQMFLELNSKRLYQSSGKEKKVVVLCSRPRQNVNSGTFALL